MIDMLRHAQGLWADFRPRAELDDSVFCIHLRNAYIIGVSIAEKMLPKE